jgi:hypothetical protein
MKDTHRYRETEKKMESRSIDCLIQEKVSDDVRLVFDGHIIFSTSFTDEIMMSRTDNNSSPRS